MRFFSVFVLSMVVTSLFSQKKNDYIFGDINARQIGPAVMSGRVSAFDAINSNPNIMYVGSAGGGVWKSNSAGSRFEPIFDEYTMSIGDITIDQKHPDTVWVGTGECWVRNSTSLGNGIYVTYNAGKTWKFKGLKETERISRVLIDPNNSNTIYVAAMGNLWNANQERGVFKSTDGGNSWKKIFYIDEHTGAADLDMNPDNPGELIVSMWSYRRYPWFFNSGMVDVDGYKTKSGVFKTTDGGNSWNELTSGLPTDVKGRSAIEYSRANPKVVYLTIEVKDENTRGLYRSNDGGNSWELVNNSNFNVTLRPFYFSNLTSDPEDENKIYKCGLNMVVSTDGGKSFRSYESSVHSDIHTIWVNPNNTKHVLLGTDGGIYESHDDAYTFKQFFNLPISQFYHVSTDNDTPYNVYGGLQDNGSWYGPSYKRWGIRNADWKFIYGGDGFYVLRHPSKKQYIFAEYQEGNLGRYDHRTGVSKDVKPTPENPDEKLRLNWNTPIHIGKKAPHHLYYGTQFLYRSKDCGDSWERISNDLTTNDPKKLEQDKTGGITVDKSSAENHCTIYTILESPYNTNQVWVGTDDGNLQLTNNGGKSWSNLTPNFTDLPKNSWVSKIKQSSHDKNVVYVTFDNHRHGDMKTYLYRTEDMGKSWERLNTSDTLGFAYVVEEDVKDKNILYLGTEYGLYISFDMGSSWVRFKNNIPKVSIQDMSIQEREDDLVMGTHGRGIIILDDLHLIRQLGDKDLTKKSLTILKTNPKIVQDPGPGGGGWFGGEGAFTGSNPRNIASIAYFMKSRHIFGKFKINVYDKEGRFVKSLGGGKDKGLNIVQMPLRYTRPKVTPSKGSALFGAFEGPLLPDGIHYAEVIKGKDTFKAPFEIKYDPNSTYSPAERKIQSQYSIKLYDMIEDIAYQYHILASMDKAIDKSLKDEKSVLPIASKIKTLMKSMVNTEGDFYVGEGEKKLAEKILDIYGAVNGFEGEPTESQMRFATTLENRLKEKKNEIGKIVANDLPVVNSLLNAKKVKSVEIMPEAKFLEKGS